jgi:pilus assembly protein Flp/PilA
MPKGNFLRLEDFVAKLGLTALFLELKAMTRFIRKLLGDEAGVTMIEYALIAALVAVAAITILTTLGTNVSKIFNTVSNKLSSA